jgi:hypothetical protein
VESLTEEFLLKEAEKIEDLPLTDIIEYIRSTIDIFVSLKVESKINEYNKSLAKDENAATDYEILLQKLESSLRQHISYEHQFKIEYDKLVDTLEEVEIKRKVLKLQIVM